MNTNISFDSFDLPDHPCPSCAARSARGFYSIRQVPVHSCLLVPSQDEAVTFPMADLQLAFCRNCGFIFNPIFDAAVHNYSSRYEESQGFSACFNGFQRRLVEHLVNDYGVRNKDVLEIGCGKGDFLTGLCLTGGNRGVGIDPSYIPGRSDPAAAPNVTFIRDFYSAAYGDLAADVIVCRHTLEHIAPVADFLRTIRRAIGESRQTLVFFEVPDVLRVLREAAFWDIYYEHCSYFSCGSLARLFRREGFEILELDLDFDDQYVLLVARPGKPGTAEVPMEDDMVALAAAVRTFQESCPAAIGRWRGLLANSRQRRRVAWGSGSKGVAFLTTLGLGEQVPYVVDINKYRQGKFMPLTAQRIVAPEFLAQYRPDDVIVMNPIYKEEIRQDLARLNLQPDLLTV